jgi:hypothetical protein
VFEDEKIKIKENWIKFKEKRSIKIDKKFEEGFVSFYFFLSLYVFVALTVYDDNDGGGYKFNFKLLIV